MKGISTGKRARLRNPRLTCRSASPPVSLHGLRAPGLTRIFSHGGYCWLLEDRSIAGRREKRERRMPFSLSRETIGFRLGFQHIAHSLSALRSSVSRTGA
jgi:hypothetical protein